MSALKWHKRFLDMANLVSTWSKDPSTQVGAVIVRNRTVVSTGYNGLPKKVDDLTERLESREKKYPMTVHAELNAILQSTQELSGAEIYVTHHPCARCAGAIIQSGIRQVFIDGSKADLNRNWDSELKLAREMFVESEIPVITLRSEEILQVVAAE